MRMRMRKKYSFRDNLDGGCGGVFVFVQKTYMVDGPKQFRELKPHLQEINAFCITRSVDDARKIISALNAYEGIEEYA